MKVERHGEVNPVRLSDVGTGHSFVLPDADEVYVKTDESDNDGRLVVSLDTGIISRFDVDEEVIPRAYKVVPA